MLAPSQKESSDQAALHITEKTVESYTSKIFDKLGLSQSAHAHRRVRAVLTWLSPQQRG